MKRKPATDFKAATRRMYYNLKHRDARCKMTLAEFREWLGRGIWSCRYCGIRLTIASVTPDHIFPLGRGGLTDIKNLDVTCRPCNTAKGELSDWEFNALLGMLNGLTAEGRAYVLRKLRSPERWYGAHKKRQAAKAKLVK